jgi:hypothetical protein
MSSITDTANAINQACPLPEYIEQNDPRWGVVSGPEKKEYYSKSPYSTISAHQQGYVVHNLVTGAQRPYASWEAANSVRAQISNRYITILNSRY